MYYHKVELCGVNTATLRVLTEEEKRTLLQLVRQGDERARKELICGNLRLVLSIVQRFSGRRECLDDLFQVGCIGLMKAIDNFNTELDVKFSTYAVPMIIGEVRRYLRDNNAIRVSRSMRDLAYRALQARDKLARASLRDPSVEEIAREMGEEKSAVSAAMEAIVEPVSLYESVYNDGEDSIYVIDQLCDRSESDETWIEDIALREAMKQLGARERTIIDMRFYRGRTQMEIAAEIGISQAQVSRLEKNALERIRRQL
jgi:RNA polymerase sporulation-specific sigma factor